MINDFTCEMIALLDQLTLKKMNIALSEDFINSARNLTWAVKFSYFEIMYYTVYFSNRIIFNKIKGNLQDSLTVK